MEEISYLKTHSVQIKHWWYQARLEIIDRVLTSHLSKNTPKTILEIGAGSGVNIGRLQQFGKVDAVEMHEGGRELIRNNFSDVETRDGSLPDPEVFAEKNYDVVCMFDVLEHVDQHQEALESIRGHINDDGRLFITVPAYQWLWSQHDVAMHHHRRYTRNTLQEVLGNAGWKVDRIGYFNTCLFPLALVARIKDLIFKPEISTGINLPSDFVNSVFRRIFSSEANRVSKGGYPFGLSLMAVASPSKEAMD